MRLAKKSILFFVADVGTSIIGFLATLYFARILGAGPLGQYFLVIALLGWLTIPSGGVASAVNKRVSEGGDDDTVLTAGTLINAAYGVVVATGTVLGGRYVEAYVGSEVSLLVAALLITNIVFETTFEGLKGQKRIATAGFLKAADQTIRAASQIALIYFGYTVIGLIGGHTLALVITALAGLFIYGFKPSLPSKDAMTSVIEYGRYSWLGSMKSKTFGWMDTLVLGLFVTSGLIGVYQVSWRLASVLILVSNAVEYTLFPEISDIAAERNYQNVLDFLSEALFYAGIFVIPGFFGTLVLGSDILRIYGPEFVKGAPILVVLILARTINVYEMQFMNVINGIDRPDVAFRINIVFIVSNVILNLVLVYLYGWYGAAVATVISSLIMLVLSYKTIVDLIGKPDLPFIDIAHEIGAAAIMAATISAVNRLFPFQNMYTTIALIGFGALVYSGCLYALSSRIRTKVRSLILA